MEYMLTLKNTQIKSSFKKTNGKNSVKNKFVELNVVLTEEGG